MPEISKSEPTVFVLDIYNRFRNKSKIRRVFKIHNIWYCILETTLEWGIPQLGYLDDEFLQFRLFNTLEEANKCVDKMLKG